MLRILSVFQLAISNQQLAINNQQSKQLAIVKLTLTLVKISAHLGARIPKLIGVPDLSAH